MHAKTGFFAGRTTISNSNMPVRICRANPIHFASTTICFRNVTSRVELISRFAFLSHHHRTHSALRRMGSCGWHSDTCVLMFSAGWNSIKPTATVDSSVPGNSQPCFYWLVTSVRVQGACLAIRIPKLISEGIREKDFLVDW